MYASIFLQTNSGPKQPGANGEAHVAWVGAPLLPRSNLWGWAQPALGVVRRAGPRHHCRVQNHAQFPGVLDRGPGGGLLLARAAQLVAAEAFAAAHQLPGALPVADGESKRARRHARLR